MDDEFVKIGYIGVDAGMVVIADPSYITEDDVLNNIYRNTHEEGDKVDSRDFVAVRSGLGDGVYPVYACYVDVPGWGRRVAEVRIVFIENADESAAFMDAVAGRVKA